HLAVAVGLGLAPAALEPGRYRDGGGDRLPLGVCQVAGVDALPSWAVGGVAVETGDAGAVRGGGVALGGRGHVERWQQGLLLALSGSTSLSFPGGPVAVCACCQLPESEPCSVQGQVLRYQAAARRAAVPPALRPPAVRACGLGAGPGQRRGTGPGAARGPCRATRA